MTVIVQAVLGINLPRQGSTTATLPESITQEWEVSLFMSAELQGPFWIGVNVAVL